MKTRIISGASLIIIVAALFWLQLYLPIALVIAAAILGAMGVFEILNNTKLCQNKALLIVSALPALVVPFVAMGYLAIPLTLVYTLYAIIVFVLILKFHSQLDIKSVLSVLVLPIFISFALATVVCVTQYGNVGLFYILAVLCWSALADTGAYFVGVTFGKHKMAPVVSPKKSVEGAIGGLVLSSAFNVAVFAGVREWIFGGESAFSFAFIIIMSVVLSAVSMLGDLSASLLKRNFGIKDFGNIMPGHGGIMDRFDSLIFVAPVLAAAIKFVNM